MGISDPEIKKLYGLSAGRCNICKLNLFENKVHIGEMAHVIARNLTGARGREDLDCERNSYENLILLCPNHHREVDRKPDAYPVSRLLSIKQAHEQAVAAHFDAPRDLENDIAFLNLFMTYVPFTRLRFHVESLPQSTNVDFFLVGDMFSALCIDNPHLYPLNDSGLGEKFGMFMQRYYVLWELLTGYTDVEGRLQANYGGADRRANIHLEKRFLPYKAYVSLSNQIEEAREAFLVAYYELMEFIRVNYKNVNLSAYAEPRL